MRINFKYYVAAWAVLLAVFNVVVFAVRPALGGLGLTYDAGFWIAWGLVIAAFAGQLFCAATAFKSDNLDKLFLNIPLITQSYSSLILMVISGCVLMLIPNCPAWIAAVVCVIIFGFSAVSIIKAKAAAEIAGGVEYKVKENTQFIRRMTAEAESLMNRANNEEIKAELKNVYEALRYSAPVSSPGLADIEGWIESKFKELSNAVSDGNKEAIDNKINDVTELIEERNSECRSDK